MPVKQVRVAINGFGRIGRLVFRLLNEMTNIDVVLINELHADGVRNQAGEPLLHPEAYYTLNYLPNEE